MVHGSSTRVSTRKSDFQLHLNEILKALELKKDERGQLVRELKKFGLNFQGWVPFRDGVFVCQAMGLSEELQPLFTQSN